MHTAPCLFLSTALAITAVASTVRILVETGQLGTTNGQTFISEALFNDILGLLILAWLTALFLVGSTPDREEFLILFRINWIVLCRHRILWTIRLSTRQPSNALFEDGGTENQSGLVRRLLGRKIIYTESYNSAKHAIFAMTLGFLTPTFFASINLNLRIRALNGARLFLFILIPVAFFRKIISTGFAARAFSFLPRDFSIIGEDMCLSGTVELVIAEMGMKAGLFETNGQPSPTVENSFSTVIIMAVVPTAVSLIILNCTFRKG